MKKTIKKVKKESKQIVEIHIYIHQYPNFGNGNGGNNPITQPPYIVTC